MISINRIVVTKHGNNKVDFTSETPNAETNSNIKVIDLEKNEITPAFYTKRSTGNTTLAYTNQVNGVAPQTKVEAGTYANSTFTKGGSDVTYTLEREGNLIHVIGPIKYVSANAEVSLSAGNHVILRFAREDIPTSGSVLPAGTIAKVTNTTDPSGYLTATKTDFETDNSLVVACNVSTSVSYDLSVPREVRIAWTTDGTNLVWTKYLIDFSKATLSPAAA